MKKLFFKNASWVLFILFLLVNIKYANAQRTYGSSQANGAGGLLCVNCTVTNPANAADGNLQTYSVLRVTVGLAAQTYQDLIFSGTKPAGGTPVTVKFGSGDNLLSLTALGGVTFRAYNGSTPVGQPIAANTLLSALSNNNQEEVTFTPAQTYDRVRVTLNGGLVGALSSIYLYEAFYGIPNGACGGAIDELHGISAGLLNLGLAVGGVQDPQLAIDGDINTASTLNAGVGLVGAYAQQTVIYPNQSVIGDSVRLTVSIPSSLLTANVLSNISVTTFNGNTSNNDLTALNSGLLSVQLLDLSNNRQKMVFTFVPTKVFDRVQLRLGGVADVLSSLSFYEAQRFIPSPVVKINGVVTNSTQICEGNTATLVANAVPNTTIHWYSAATGGSPIFTGNSFTTPVLTTSKTYYVAGMRDGCTDESQRVKVTVTVNAIPDAPVVTNSTITVCSGQAATFVASSVSGVTINWYDAATGGNLVHTGNSFTTDPLTTTTSYYAEAVTGGTCTSTARKKVTATVTAPPDAPTLATPNVTVCDGSVATFSVSAPVAGVSYNWYNTATGGTSLFTGSSFTTPVLHANATYYTEAINAGGCTSGARTQATATVVPSPADPVLAANNTTISAGETASIAVTNTQTDITYNWYTSATSTTPVHTGATYTTPALYTTTTYYVGAVNSTDCTSDNRTQITITVIADDAPCSFANVQSTNVNGICIGCSVSNDALAVDADTTTASTINVLAGLVGAYAEQELRFQQPGFAGDTIKIGLGTPGGLLSATVLSQIQVLLYNGGTLVSTTPLNSNLLTVTLLGGGTNRYVVYVPASAAYDRIRIRVNSGVAGVLTALNIYYASQQFPKPVFDPVTPEICKGSTAQINITSPANGTFNWYTTPTGGSSIHTGASFTTPALTANKTYYVEYTRGTCTGTVRYPIQVLVTDDPAAPVITTQDVTVNSGQPATLNATASNGATVQWFTAATGGTPVFTGDTYTTPPLTANKTYYAGAASGSCVSDTRTPVTVTVRPVVIPNIAVTPPTKAVNAGETATFTATSTTPGAVFNWFTTPTGGTSIYTGATFTTPAEFANTTYYAEASVPSTGAISATRATGTVTINTSGVSPVSCDAAIDQTNGVSGLLCVACSINNATGSVDNDRNTFSRLNVPVGLNAYAQQTLRFANTGIAGDSIIVELGTPASLASVGVLSSIAVATYNGTTYNNDRFNVNGNLITVSLLNGTSRFRVAFKATSAFDRVEIRLNSALAGVLSSLNIYDAYQEVPAPVITTSSVTVCKGSQATITATVPANVTVKWYTSATGGSPIFTGAVFTTPALNATTKYYAEASRTADGCAQPVRTPATVTVLPAPAAPVVPAANTTVCSGNPATFSATPVSGVTFTWYSAPTGGTSLHTGNSFTTPALNATTSYYVQASNAGDCSSSTRTKVTATVTATPANAAVASATVSTCSGSSAVLTAMSSQPGVIFNWYTAATGGTPVFTGAQYTTPALTSTTSYYVETANGSCVSDTRTKVTVTVNPLPANPTVVVTPTGGNISSGQTATIAASSTTANVTFNWYTSANGGVPIFTGANFTTPVLTSNTTYYVEAASNNSGCTSAARTPVTITVNPIFSTSCDFAATQTTSINGGLACLGCAVTDPNNAVDADTTSFSQLTLPVSVGGYVGQKLIFSDNGSAGDTVVVKIQVPASLASVAVLNQVQVASYSGAGSNTYNNDRISISNSAVKIQLLAGGQTALVKFVPQAAFNAVEVRISSVASVFNTLNVYFATKQVPVPQLTDLDKTINICAGNTATFALKNTHADVTYKWYTSVTGGASVHTGTTFTTPVLNTTTTYYVEAIRTANGCANPNRIAAHVNVTPAPVVPVLSQNTVEICAGDQVILSVTNANGATVNWYSAATGGTLLFTGADYAVSPIATTSYYAELVNAGNCSSATRKKATVTVDPRPAAPGLQSADVQTCSGSTAVLSVLNPASGVNYQWFTTGTGGTAVHTGNTFTTPALTQNKTYYVQGVNATSLCTNMGGRTAANVTVTGQLATPTLSATTTQVCNGGSVTLSVKNPVAGLQYTWYTQATGGTAIFTGTTYTATNLTADISYYVEAANGSGCTSDTRAKTTVNVQPLPTAPQVTADAGGLSVCMGSSAALSVVSPKAGYVYRWYGTATSGTVLYTGTQFNTPALTANTSYYVEASQAGNCNPSATTKVTVTVTALPTDPTLADANVEVCSGSPATFIVISPQANVTYQWFDSPSRSHKLFEGTKYVTGPITATTTFYVGAVNATGCQNTNLTTAVASLETPPSNPAVTGGTTQTVCTNTPLTLSIQNPQSGFIYKWYTTATGNNSVSTGTSYTTPVISAAATFYVSATNTLGCESASRTAINVTPGKPVAPVVTTPVDATCAGNTAVLTATAATGTTINWYASATGGTLLSSGSTFTTPALTTTTTYYAEAVTAAGCSSSSRTAAVVNVQPLPSTPQVIASGGGLTVCMGSSTTLGIVSPQAGITYKWYGSATGGTMLYTGTQFKTPLITAKITYYVDATQAGNCNSSARTAVTVKVAALPASPVLANATVNVCPGSDATFTVSSPQAGVTYQWFDSPAQDHKLFEGTTYVSGPITTATKFYVAALNATGCQSTSLTTAIAGLQAPPAAPTVASVNGGTACMNSHVTLSIENPIAGYTYKWYASAISAEPINIGTSYTSPLLSRNTVYFVSAVNTSGCESATRTGVPIALAASPQAPLAAAPAGTLCPGTSTVLKANADNGMIVQWFTSASGGTAVSTGASFTTPALSGTTTYYAGTVNTGGCPSPARTPVVVAVLKAPAAPIVTVAETTGTSVTFNWSSVAGATGYQISTDNGLTFSNAPDSRTYTVSNLQPLQSITVIIRAIGTTDCQVSANSAAAIGTTTNPQGNSVFIPNAFSPNGDGNNDIFLVYGTTVQNVTMSIYDQWGGMLFRSTNQGSGWDGTYKGRAQPVGTYVYYIEATLSDGQKITRKGTINLLR